MQTPKLSVIIPVYKTEKYLSQMIDSVIAQPCKDLEIILIDDGSPDKSPQICDEYAKMDSRISVFHKENGGVSSARNLGLDVAKGEYILFLDSDDVCVPNSYNEEVHDMLDGCDAVFFDLFIGDEYCNIIDRQDCPRIRNGNTYDVFTKVTNLPLPSSILSRKNIEENNIRFNTSYTFNEDFFFRMYFALTVKTYKITEKPLFIYRRNPNGAASRPTTEKRLYEFSRHIKERHDFSDRLLAEGKEEKIANFMKYIIVGTLQEYLIGACFAGFSFKEISGFIESHGLKEYFAWTEKYSFNDKIRKDLYLWVKHPRVFIIKYRTSSKLRWAAKAILPQKAINAIRKLKG